MCMNSNLEATMRKCFGVFLAVLMAAGTTVICTAADHSKEKAAAIQSAKNWLQLVDNEKYGESWDSAAAKFKEAISRDKWEQAMKQVRGPLGKLVSRTVKSATYATSLPGAPNGKYVVIQFETSFANKKSAVETITPMLDSDGKWHVSGYFIR
jgi:hypothetical protein